MLAVGIAVKSLRSRRTVSVHPLATASLRSASNALVASASDPKLCRVFTGATSFTPSSEVWSKISAASEVTVELVGAAFENNRIPSGAGPFLGSTTALTITP